MTEQEVFDTVATHLITQGRPAVDEWGTCLYRTQGGLKCAVGCLIPEEVYHPDMESRSAIDVIRDTPALSDLEPHHTLLRMLQMVHDNWAADWGVEDAREPLLDALRRLAQHHHLSSEVVR